MYAQSVVVTACGDGFVQSLQASVNTVTRFQDMFNTVMHKFIYKMKRNSQQGLHSVIHC
jgi:hypothetical protein